jgi:ribosome maturation factor RimP
MSLEQDIANMAASLGLDVYDIVTTSRDGDAIFEVLVTSKGEGSVSLDSCAELSHLLSPLLDVTPPMSGEYRLEVGTPGIERKLKTIAHFENSVGELVKATLIAGDFFKGKLLKVEGEKITIDDQESGSPQTFDFSELQKARTYFEW